MSKLLTAIFFFTLSASGFSQEMVFTESSLENTWNHHFNQMWMVEISLKEYRLRPQIEFADDYDFKTEFEQLSNNFKQAIPIDYWKAKSRPALTDTLNQTPSNENFIQWTYGKIEKDKVINYYGQLIVYFSDRSTSATVTRVLFKNSKELVTPNSKKVIELYEQYKADRLKNPPPPSMPIPLGGN